MIYRDISSLSAAILGSCNLFLTLINKSRTLSHVSQIHSQVVLNGFQYDLATLTKLIQKLSDFHAIRQARDLFYSISKPNIFLCNVLIRGVSNNASPSSSISLYTHLRNSIGLKPDNFTYAFAIMATSGFSDEKMGTLLHVHSIVDGLGFNLYAGSAVVDFYFKFSRVEIARNVFDRMPKRETVLWNTMITGLVKNYCCGDSVEVFKDMVAEKVQLDAMTVATVLLAAAELHLCFLQQLS